MNKLSLSFLMITFKYDHQIHDDRQKSDFTTEILTYVTNIKPIIRSKYTWEWFLIELRETLPKFMSKNKNKCKTPNSSWIAINKM